MSKKSLTVDIPSAIPSQEFEEHTGPGTRRRPARKSLHRVQDIATEDVEIDEELSTPLEASPLVVDTGPVSYTFLEMRQEFDFSVLAHQEWLQKINLLQFARLPCKR
ncbi:hypothetical protein GOP47_0023912 [Adiantum capillus-veneris]|uniref:Uncharacterized protein n=1 Tax=Adiantum capillus-veneris TaxID=13818 RepID=A0A9D4U5I2_ADICA|nr:hypothetical protein GOP47_0023912 [Adiantum capillus-veneris]